MYRNCKKLGNGAFADTYYSEVDGSAYTVKRYKKEINEIHFNNEVSILTKLLNYDISVPRLHEVNTVDRCIIYRYIDGVHLDKVAYKQDTLANLLRRLLTTLSALHRVGICHRDIKPSNILYSCQSQTFTLIDFGLACCTGGNGGEAVDISKKKVAGTSGYVLPDLLESSSYRSIAELYSSDLFAVGVCAYKYINNHDPFYVNNRADYKSSYRGDHLLISIAPSLQTCIKDMLLSPETCTADSLLALINGSYSGTGSTGSTTSDSSKLEYALVSNCRAAKT